MLSAISGKGEWAVTVFDVSLARSIGASCRSDGAIISSADFRIAQGGRFLKGVLRGGGVASEASWTVDTFKGLDELDPRLPVLTLSAAIIRSSIVYACEFCNRGR